MRARLFVACIFLSTKLFAQVWEVTEMAPMPEPVSNNAVIEAIVNGIPHVYSFSGIDTTKSYSGIHLRSFKYNSQTNQWTSITPLPDTLGKIAAAASYVKGIIYIIGGYHVFSNGSELSSGKVHRFDPATDTYLSDGADIPKAIDDQVQAVWRDSLIYVITGWSNTNNVSDVQIYNPSLDVWTNGTPLPPPGGVYRSFGASGAIVGDTIYYFGGANAASGFPIQNVLRKGAIDPNDPTQITWSSSVPDAGVVGYRMACTEAFGNIHWIGGSNQTYNYDGLAYSNGAGVPNNNRNLYWSNSQQWQWDSSQVYPMDLRGIAKTSDSIRYLAGGMEAGQTVSSKTLRLKYKPLPISLNENVRLGLKIKIYPNPSTDLVTIAWGEEEVEDLKLLDSKGATLKEFKGLSSPYRLDVSTLPKGIYWIKSSNISEAIQLRVD